MRPQITAEVEDEIVRAAAFLMQTPEGLDALERALSRILSLRLEDGVVDVPAAA